MKCKALKKQTKIISLSQTVY